DPVWLRDRGRSVEAEQRARGADLEARRGCHDDVGIAGLGQVELVPLERELAVVAGAVGAAGARRPRRQQHVATVVVVGRRGNALAWLPDDGERLPVPASIPRRRDDGESTVVAA